MKTNYELLAPAGDFSMLSAAVNAGADAVYFGLQEFSMRAAAKNFTIKDLDEIEKICRPKGVKRYLTLNTIIYDDELESIEKIIQEIRNRVDAVICWDFSVISLCKKYNIPFFISTQASVANTESALFYKKLGAKRIVLARELNLKQIKELTKIPGLELECFVHGSMCISVSGRCFTSQFLFNKSANRGECLHPCRRAYTIRDEEGNELKVENNRVLSAKDLCTLPFIEKMKQAGIKCFKIEGRNRDARYVDMVVRVYRRALDNKLSEQEVQEGIKELGTVYNREFSSGFYLKTPTSDDFSKIEGSASGEKKHLVGKVTHYFTHLGVAAIKLVSELKVGDDIVVIGNVTGIQKSKVARIEINKKSVKKAGKGKEVGIKIPKIGKNDEVYTIKNTRNF
jgi:putative protease